MTLLSRLGRPTVGFPSYVLRRPPRAVVEPQDDDEQPLLGGRVFAVQRLGAMSVGLFLLVFGLLGAAGGVGFLSTHGQRYLGMSSNGLLSALSIVVAAVLLGAALRGPHPASTVMVVLGVLFIASALLNMALLRLAFNVLAFRMSNVVLSAVVGLLLVLGAYGRISGKPAAGQPLRPPARPRRRAAPGPSLQPGGGRRGGRHAGGRDRRRPALRDRDQQRRVEAMSGVRTRDGRRRIWMEFDETAGSALCGGPEPGERC